MKRAFSMMGLGCLLLGSVAMPSGGHAAEGPQASQTMAASPQTPHQMRLTRDQIEGIYFDAARAGRNDIISGLIGQGIGPNIHNQKGDTPLILATYYGHLDTVNLLISHGAEPCGKDKKGNTALMGAAFKGESAIVRRLSEAGCPVNTQNDVRQTALMMAALFGRTDTVKTLLELGADPSLVDAGGATALSLAEAQGDGAMVSLLEDALKHHTH